MAALLIGNLIEFQVQQDSAPNYYRPLPLRSSSLLSSIVAPARIGSYYRVQETIGRAELFGPNDPAFQNWKWRNLAFVDVIPGWSRTIQPAEAQKLRRRTLFTLRVPTFRARAPTTLLIRVLVDPDEIREGRGILLPVSDDVRRRAPKALREVYEVFLVSEAALPACEEFLE